MSAFFPVYTSMYDHAFASLSMGAQLLEFYLRTCPQRSSEGLFRFNVGTISDDLGIERTTVLNAVAELETARRAFFFDHDAGVVLDLTALRDNPLGKQRRGDQWKGPDKRITGAIRKMKSLPETPLLKHLLVLAEKHSPELADAMRDEFPDIEEPLAKALEAPSSPSKRHQGPSQSQSRSSEEESRVRATELDQDTRSRADDDPVDSIKQALLASEVGAEGAR